jgi:hypothetical protein
MISLIQNTATCPIVYNTTEQLKKRLEYRKKRSRRG